MVFPPGQTLQNGKYKLETTLGKGGFGLTYRAQHTGFQAPLVLKSPNDELQTDPEYPKFVARFFKEGKMLWELSKQRHAHIVRVTDLFEEMGVPWLVMDYIRGESLFDRVRRKGPLPEAETIGFMEQIGSALQAVHRVQLVHRDAHPGNIMILPPDPQKTRREAMLIDFGIAGEMFPSTVSSKFFGNPAFAPYEQFGLPADPSMDVYTLAASCYLAVTGVLPESAMNRKLYGRGLVAPRQHRGTLSQGLNQAILKGMELEAQNRPSLSEWLRLLQPVPVVTAPTVPADGRRIRDLSNQGKAQPLASPQPAAPPQGDPVSFNLPNRGGTLTFVWVPGGELVMVDGGHRVQVPKFRMGKYPITQRQYQAIMGENPSYCQGNDLNPQEQKKGLTHLDRPVERVTWHQAIEFCQKLTQTLKIEGYEVRLPSETMWEWAARDGENSSLTYGGSDDLDQVGWYSKNSDSKTHPVGQKQANKLGIHNMSGNIWEWCWDNWASSSNELLKDGKPLLKGGNNSYRAVRGGSWDLFAVNCRSGHRNCYNPVNRSISLGFHVVLLPVGFCA